MTIRDIQTYWDQQWPVMDQIFVQGMESYVSSIVDIDRAFQLSDRSIRCIDEGTPGGIHAAGSGILLSESAFSQFLRAAHPDGISSHAGCGAAGFYAKLHDLDPFKADDYGKEFASRMSERFGIPYTGHIDFSQMKRPAEFHIARVAYYDGSGSFDPSRVSALPPGFVISRRYLSRDDALREVEIALSIAFGHHGFHELVTPSAPFLLCVIGDTRAQNFSLPVLKAEFEGRFQEYGKRCIVAGFSYSLEGRDSL